MVFYEILWLIFYKFTYQKTGSSLQNAIHDESRYKKGHGRYVRFDYLFNSQRLLLLLFYNRFINTRD